MKNNNKKIDFLDYTGICKVDKNKYYHFEIKNLPDIVSSCYTRCCDPTIDNIFKGIFRKESIAQNILNELLFPETHKIKKLEFSSTEFPGRGKYTIGSIRLDLGCKCQLDEESEQNEEKENKDCDIFIDFELQLGFSNKLTNRFIHYANIIEANITTNKSWVVALILDKKSNFQSSITGYKKEGINQCKVIKEYDKCYVIEINLNHCLEQIKNNEDVFLLDREFPLNKNGYEWIKFLSLSNWCYKLEDGIFAMPDLNLLNFYNSQVEEAFKSLIYNNDPMYKTYLSDVKEYKQEMWDLLKKVEELETKDKLREKEFKEIKKQFQEREKQLEKELKKKDKIIERKDNEIIKLKKRKKTMIIEENMEEENFEKEHEEKKKVNKKKIKKCDCSDSD